MSEWIISSFLTSKDETFPKDGLKYKVKLSWGCCSPMNEREYWGFAVMVSILDVSGSVGIFA